MFYCERCGEADCCERFDLPTEPVLCDACYKKATREKLIDVFMHIGDHIKNKDEYGICFDTPLVKAIEDVLVMLKSIDGNDAVEVPCRCKECKYWKHYDHLGCTEFVKVCTLAYYMIGENGYCLYGERREGE